MSSLNGGESHQAHCECNHAGSSPDLEMSAAGDLFQRPEKRLYLRYTEVISDGDIKTVSNLNAVVKPYGKDVTISKHECVGHVQKRVTKHIKAVKKVSK